MAKDWAQIERRFGARLADDVKPLEPRFNIAVADEPGDGEREPFDLTLDDGGMFAFAGLWAARKNDAANEWLVSCTIITTKPNELVARLHDRMPVILPREAEADWLGTDISIEHAMSLLEPYPAELMRSRAASPLVNSARNDGPELLIPPDENPR